MKKLSLEEKLNLCVEFIKKIEKMDAPTYDICDLVTLSGTCEDCGSDDVEIDIPDFEIVEPAFLDDLKSQAWHVLADITD